MPDATAFDPARLDPELAEIYRRRMGFERPKQIAFAMSMSEHQIKHRLARLRRMGAVLPLMRDPVNKRDGLTAEEERVVKLRAERRSAWAIADLMGMTQARVEYILGLARRLGHDVNIPARVYTQHHPMQREAVRVTGTHPRGYPRSVIGATKAEALAWWHKIGGTIDRVEVVR